MKKNDFRSGLQYGLPIGMGYLSVSFTFGMLAAAKGVPTIGSLLISMTNLTSAGQVAGLFIIAAGGSLAELAICQLVINLRYALMSITLSQKLSGELTLADKLFISFGITDEIFAVMAAHNKPITRKFFLGLLILPYAGWSCGTLLGASFGGAMPQNLAGVLGIALYGMFLAIIVPPAKKHRNVLAAVVIAAALSCVLYFVPLFSSVSQGISIIVCAVIASAVCAKVYPITKTQI